VSVPNLSTRGKAAIDAASPQEIQNVFATLSTYFRTHSWVDNSNRYRSKIVETLRIDKQSASIDQASLAEYIAASAPLHCADAWSFLGRALTCHAQGDGDSARHFAYYAELRGAASLLAAEGIGIFSNLHYAIDTSGTCKLIRDAGGTHKASWLVLEYWSSQPRSADLISAVVSPAGIPLADWLDAFGATSTLLPIGTDWLKSWGLDLKRLSEDRETRNEASYRPTRLTSRTSLNGSDSANFLYNLWNLHEPFPFSRFEVLDRHLLRLSFELAYKAITGKEILDEYKFTHEFSKRANKAVELLSPGGLSKADWKNFLARVVEPKTPALINEADGDVGISDPSHHIQVIARATLLLRLATGACARLLNAAGVGQSELEFWWKSLGEDRGLWEPENEPNDLTELWSDIEIELENMAEWNTANAGDASIARWLEDRSRTINVLGGCERIALWGLGL
jgi:hypothetical protein